MILCDGSYPSGEPCQSQVCFVCAKVKKVPQGDFYCGARQRPDTASTPPGVSKQSKQSTVISPDLREKIRNALVKDNIPAFPSDIGRSGMSPMVSNGGVSEALTLITSKLESMDIKLGNVVTVENHVNGLQALKVALIQEFETKISRLETKFAEMELANVELRRRVDSLEAQLKSITSGPDPSHRRITFIGFETVSALDRITFISSWMETNFAGVRCSVGNIARGPMHSRTLTKVSYAEFSDSDTRHTVLASIRSRGLTCAHNGKTIQVKPALSQAIRTRIWALNKAEELIGGHAYAQGKSVVKTSTPTTRTIAIGGEILFEQKPNSSDAGVFLGPCASLLLPVGAASRST